MAKMRFTDANIRLLPAPSRAHRIDYAEADVRGFAIQTTYTGSKKFLLVYVAKATGRERRLVLGPFGAAPMLSVSAARQRAREVRAMVELGRDPWLEHKEHRAAAEARRQNAGASFGDLMSAYAESLYIAGKPSADSVKREIRATVEIPFKQLWKMPAIDITLDQLIPLLTRLTRANKWRQAEKTRSYIRAAYTAAASSRGRATASDLFAPFATLPNLGRDLATIDRPRSLNDEEGKRSLTLPELQAYWRRIRNMQGATGALLRAHLLTGAQRCAQLARLTRRAISQQSLTILDGKGRRKKARTHVVPLLPAAVEAFASMQGEGDYIFTLDGGATGAGFHAVRRKLVEVSQAMCEAGEITELFTPGELRITVETRLAAAGIPQEVRAQLQSHGLGGVQQRHYDKHDYITEKRGALETLMMLLEPATGDVLQFPAMARKA